MADECTNKNIFGRLRCEFQPRYDIKHENIPEIRKAGVSVAESFFGSSRAEKSEKIYVCDVCIACGRRINRGDAVPPLELQIKL